MSLPSPLRENQLLQRSATCLGEAYTDGTGVFAVGRLVLPEPGNIAQVVEKLIACADQPLRQRWCRRGIGRELFDWHQMADILEAETFRAGEKFPGFTKQ